MVMNRFAGYFLNLFLLPCDEWIHLSNVVILLFLLIQLPLDGEATSFVLFHASTTTTTTTTTKTSRLRNRDGDSDYQMKIAELFMVAQYYGALYLASIQYCRFYFVPLCFLHCPFFFFPESAYTVCEHSTGYGIATQEGFQDHGNWCYVTYM